MISLEGCHQLTVQIWWLLLELYVTDHKYLSQFSTHHTAHVLSPHLTNLVIRILQKITSKALLESNLKTIHHFLLVNSSSHLITEGDWIGQALFAFSKSNSGCSQTSSCTLHACMSSRRICSIAFPVTKVRVTSLQFPWYSLSYLENKANTCLFASQ